MAGLGALATQFFKKPKPKPKRNESTCTRHVTDSRRSRDPKEKYRGGRRVASEASSSGPDSTRSGRGNSGPSGSHATRPARTRNGRGPHRQGQSDPIPSPSRRTMQGSHDGPFHSHRPRGAGGASRKHDWGYDSGYASAEESRSDASRVSDPYRKTTGKGRARAGGRRQGNKGS